MPELPEVEMTARLIGRAVTGSRVAGVHAAAINTLKSFDPPVDRLAGKRILGLRRRGKHLIIDFEEGLSLLIHLMSAGRLQLYDVTAARSDRTVRFAIGLEDDRQVRLREFGTRQSSWVKLVKTEVLEREEALATLGPEAWPDPPDFSGLLSVPRPLHNVLRDQRVISGIGRSWVDEILHAAMTSPFKRAGDLTRTETGLLRDQTVEVLDRAIRHYEENLALPLPDKFPMPLEVHGRAGSACPRCGQPIAAVHFEDHDLCYCPRCQTEGRVLKDRRLSRLLK